MERLEMPTLLKCFSGNVVKGISERRRTAQSICLSLLVLLPLASTKPTFAQVPGLPTKMPLAKPGESGSSSLVLTSGDLLDVEIFNTPELSVPRLRIGQDGSIVMPVVGNIKVAGLTPLEADMAVEKSLRDAQIMINPSVTILVVDYSSQGIDVLGEVKAPGIYNFIGTHSLYDALSAAGGATAAQGSTITITHHDDPTNPMIVHVSGPNYSAVQHSTLVQPGDVVEVSRADAFYVVGDVSRSGQYPIPYGRPITALNALALAAGPNKTAKLGKASIVRKNAAGGVQLIPVDLTQIEKNAAPDPVLEADDVLIIPRSGLRGFLDVVVPGATATVIGAIAYGYIRN
jgi:polysaccharide export outer membrane protein